MNRMEEYKELLDELEQLTDDMNKERSLDKTLERAVAKKRRKNLVFKPLIGFAASFVLFVFLVNFSVTVADACSQIPVLRELAKAVTFSPSLTDAVENEYVQPMNLFDQNGAVSAKVEYLIVDQKQVNIFFRLYSDEYKELDVDPEVEGVEKELESYSVAPNDYNVPNGELRSVTVDFINSNVPASMKLILDIRAGELAKEQIVTEEEQFNPSGPSAEEYVAHLEFVLEFDPEFTGTGKMMNVNQTVELEGQKITITDIEIYPSHMRINVSDAEENTAWLKRLNFYIETDWGKKFEPVTDGITATGDGSSKSMISYHADSTYFYEAKKLKLVITSAEWLRKDMDTVYVNLRTKKAEKLPEGVELYLTEEKSRGWIVQFKAECREKDRWHQIMMSDYYDKEGNEYSFHSWGTGFFDLDVEEQEKYFIEEIRLTDYHEDEVWLSPAYSHVCEAEEPIVIEIK